MRFVKFSPPISSYFSTHQVEQAEAAIRLKEEQENKRRKDAFGDSALGFDSEGF